MHTPLSHRAARALTLAAILLAACATDPVPTAPDGAVYAPDRSDALTLIVEPGADVAASLASALTMAPTGSTITFHPALAGTVILLGTPIATGGRTLTIEGPPGGVTLSGGGGTPLAVVDASGTLALRGLSLVGGRRSLAIPAARSGGITSYGSLALDRVTMSGNATPDFFLPFSTDPGYGGAIHAAAGTVLIQNSTISGNSAGSTGGGIFTGSEAITVVVNSTIAGNTAPTVGGILAAGVTTLENTLFASNSGDNCAMLFSEFPNGVSVSDDASCGDGAHVRVVDDLLLGALQDNGSGLRTHLPLAGSPALDVTATCASATDQRGIARPQGAGCDAGAVERAVATVALDAGGKVTTAGAAIVGGTLTCSGAQPVRVAVSLSQAQKIRKVATTVTGSASDTFPCDGTGRWSLTIVPANGVFVNAGAVAEASATTDDVATATRSVKLSWAR